jgi:hypothetical protein
MTSATSTPQAPAPARARSASGKKSAAKKTTGKKKSAGSAAKKSITKRKSAAPKSAGAGVRRTAAAEVAPETQPKTDTKSGAQQAEVSSPAISQPSDDVPATGAATDAETPQMEGQPEPTESEIRVRAYFIAERRAQMSVVRDPAFDWIEAREQLIAEAHQSQP